MHKVTTRENIVAMVAVMEERKIRREKRLQRLKMA
ncbi:hypothetical protein FHW04_001463 [Pantoea sp. AN62]